MSDPNIIYNINWTLLISVIAVSCASMGTLVAIFRNKTKDDDKPGGSHFCKQHTNEMKRIENSVTSNLNKIEKIAKCDSERQEQLKELCNNLEKEVVVLKNESKNNTKNIDEMKQNIKEVATKLDDLLRQLMDLTTD